MNKTSCTNCYYRKKGKCTLQMAEKGKGSDFCYHWTPKKDSSNSKATIKCVKG